MNNHYHQLTIIPGISSHEKLVSNYMESIMRNYPQYKIIKDNLGSIYAFKKSKKKNAKTVMVAGHLDEVGLMVKGITENGSLEILPIGGLNSEVFISQVVYVYNKDNLKIPGVIGSVPPHLKVANKISFDSLLVDIGTDSKAETEKYGISIGDMVLFDTPFIETINKKRFIAKAIDNRFGCALALEAIEYFKDYEFDFNIAVGATVQEEVGLRGAETSTNLFKPDVFIALDSSPLNDIFDKNAVGKLGEGFLLRLYDPRNIMLKNLKDYFIEIATKNNIRYQPYFSMGGTDAAKAISMHEGIIATTIGLPARYIHSTAAIADWDDVASAREMLFALIKDLSEEKINELKEV